MWTYCEIYLNLNLNLNLTFLSPPGMEHERYASKPSVMAVVTGGIRPVTTSSSTDQVSAAYTAQVRQAAARYAPAAVTPSGPGPNVVMVQVRTLTGVLTHARAPYARIMGLAGRCGEVMSARVGAESDCVILSLGYRVKLGFAERPRG